MNRNFICAFVALLLFVGSVAAKDAKELFNGKDLTGWEGDARVWSVENGAIVGHTKDVPLKNNTFLIWKDGKVGDFKLTVEFKLEGGNSGIQYRSKVIDPKQWIVGGYQADMDGANQYTGIMYEERGRGILAKRGEKLTIERDGTKEAAPIGNADELAKAIHKDDWNVYEIEAIGSTLKHTINGKLMSETIDRDAEHRATSGILALQVHANLPAPMTVSYRKIRLEEVEAKEMKKGKGSKKKAKAV
jgi:3-keto-disaccharide hydrolase